jgi:tetratricopeptide (TPR) repeat protein
MKQSRLLSRLDAEIARSGESVSLHCLRIERSCYLARKGDIEEARATLYEKHPNVIVSSWLSLAEGLLIHFSNMGHEARDKVHRAYALSAAAGLTQLSALSAAWLAHMDYSLEKFPGMAGFVSQALQLANNNNHSALSRATLVTADAYHLAGRIDLARPWYAKAHRHATAEGDDATISALMHNMAWLRFDNQRQAIFNGGVVTPSGEHALASVESTIQFESLVGADGLHALSPILRAQILTENGKFSEALAAYDLNLASAIQQGMGRLHGNLKADEAWCRLNLGQTEEARADASVAEALLDPRGYDGDRAPAHRRLSQVFAGLGDPDSSKRHDHLARASWAQHRLHQQQILDVLTAPQNNAILNFLR